MELSKQIKASNRAIQADRKVFSEWEEGKISVWECIDAFRENNRIKRPIDPEQFERWLNSLGYWRVDL